MEIDRHVERFGALEDRPEPLLVEKGAVGKAVDHRALEATARHRALELVRSGLGIGRRQCGEFREPVRARAARLVEEIVGLAREFDRGLGLEHLRSRLYMRQDLDIDARLVHLGDAPLADIGEFDIGLVPAHAVKARETVAHARHPEMLLERDDALLRHDCSSLPIFVTSETVRCR